MQNKLQYISQGSTSVEQLKNIQHALENGCKWIQLRWKNVSEEEFMPVAMRVKELCKRHGATFIINDYVEWAKTIDADGIHLGLDDARIAEARKLLGEDKIIGGTANTFQDVLQRIDEQCDYIGLGPFRFTTTKDNLSPVLGLEGYTYISEQLKVAGKQAKIYAIGGIRKEDISSILETGIYGIAVSGLLTHTNILVKDFLPQ